MDEFEQLYADIKQSAKQDEIRRHWGGTSVYIPKFPSNTKRVLEEKEKNPDASPRQIARKLGISQSSVWSALKKNNGQSD